MRKTLCLFMLSLLVCGVTAAQAQEISYNYAEAAYQWVAFDEEGVGNSNGLDTKLSVSPIEYFALETDYNFQSFKIDGMRTHLSSWTYGALGYYPFCDNVHAVFRIGGILAHENVLAWEGFTKNGIYSGAGLRYQFENDAELEGNITYSHLESSDADWEYEGVGLYPIVGKLALKGSAAINDEADVTLTGGLRYSF